MGPTYEVESAESMPSTTETLCSPSERATGSRTASGVVRRSRFASTSAAGRATTVSGPTG